MKNRNFRSRIALRAVAAGLSALLLVSMASAQELPSRYVSGPFAIDMFRLDTACLVVSASFAGDVLRGVKMSEEQPPAFKKRGQSLHEFSDEIEILVDAYSVDCPRRVDLSNIRLIPRKTIADLARAEFVFEWLDAESHSEARELHLRPNFLPPGRWYMTVPAARVPLSARARIRLLASDGVTITELTGSLADAMRKK